MSSLAVRTAIKDFLDDNSEETVIDLTAESEDFKILLSESGVQPDAPFLGLQFIGGETRPISLAATNDQGLYREFGSVILHVCDIGRIGVGNSLLTRGEALINLFMGQRIGDIVIDSLSQMNTEVGATLEFEGGYVSGSIQITFYRDLNL